MKWLLSIDTEDDIIVACRLMNIFRRKGLNLLALSMVESPEGYSIMAVVESSEADWEHNYNFIRRTEGVRQATGYREEPSASASYAFVNSEAASTEGAWTKLPGARVILASHGKILYQLSASQPPAGAHGENFMSFAAVRSTRD